MLQTLQRETTKVRIYPKEQAVNEWNYTPAGINVVIPAFNAKKNKFNFYIFLVDEKKILNVESSEFTDETHYSNQIIAGKKILIYWSEIGRFIYHL